MILLNNSQVKIDQQHQDNNQYSDEEQDVTTKNNQKIQNSDKKNKSPVKDDYLKFPTKASLLKNSSQPIKPFKFGGSDSAANEVFYKKMYQLRDFNFKINYSNRLFIQHPETQANYKVYVGRGNNRKLIKNFFQRRWWWTIEDNIDNIDSCQFVWTQLKIDKFIQMLPMEEIQNYEKLLEVNVSTQKPSKLQENKNGQKSQNMSPSKRKNLINNNVNSGNPQNKLQAQQQQAKIQLQDENLKRIFNSGDFQDFKTYNSKYGVKDQDLMAEDLQFRFNFIQTDSTQTSKLFKKLPLLIDNNKQQFIQQKTNEDNSPNKSENNNNSILLKKNSSQNNIEKQDSNANLNSILKKQSSKCSINQDENENDKQNDENQLKNSKMSIQKLQEEQKISTQNVVEDIQKPQIMNSYSIQCNNHFEFNWNLGNKKALYYNMKQYYQLVNKDIFEFLPLTFHIIKGQQDPEYKKFLQNFKRKRALINKQEKEGKAKGEKTIRNIWIIKPGEISNRGNGISVCDELSQINRIFYKKEKHAQTGKLKTYIIQEYMDRPFLYKQRKFDIRCYLLITQVNSIMKAYWYEEGYIRTSGDKFTLDDVTDVFVHLTNDAIQKQSETYQKYEDGNKLSYNDFQRYLDNTYTEQKLNFFEQVLPQMKQITLDSVKAGYMTIDKNKRQTGFEIFGLDYMIDINFKPWLIEINTNPDITTSSQLLQRLIPNMLENAFRIAIDPLFPCPNQWPGPKRHLAQDNILENNKFQLIFDEITDGQEIKDIYKNQENYVDQIGEIDEEEEIKSDDEDNLEEIKL